MPPSTGPSWANTFRSRRVLPVLGVMGLVLPALACGCQSTTADTGASVEEDAGETAPPIGEPPTVRASSSVYAFVFPGDEVQLSGTGSDPDQGDTDPDPLLRWVQISGSDVALSGADTPEVAFTVPGDAIPGETLGFELRVTDADGNTTADWVYLFVPRGEAVLLAAASGPNDPAPAGSEVKLSSRGSVNIPEETAVYEWRQLEGGPRVELADADASQATFVAPDPGADDVTLTFRLTLENGRMSAEAVAEVVVVPAEDP